jgi:hypothetical protein
LARAVAIFSLVVALAATLKWWEPFVTQERAVATATPSPGPRGAAIAVPLARGARLCVGPVPIDAATGRAQFMVGAARPGATDLSFEVGQGAVAVQPVLQAFPTAVSFPVPAGSQSPNAQVCVRNGNRTRLSFLGTNDALAIGPARTTVDGKEPAGQAVELELYEAKAQSVLDRLGTIVHRASDFTGNLMPFWLAWLLVVALVIGTPFAIFAAFWSTLRAD